ncbi:MAG: SDR family NAD(P)-dependent oxidoreductase, partial [Candidatus Binatia bacterium]
LSDWDEGALVQTVEYLRGSGEPAGFQMDVRDYEQCVAMVDKAIELYDHVDILVNSAGIGGGTGFFRDETPHDWQALLDINLRGVMNCCRAVVDHMCERRYGKIVSLASEAGKGNEKRMVAYGTTKGGVISLSRGLALELGRYSINVNAVCPGVTETPMIDFLDHAARARAAKLYPLGRLGKPEDSAAAITFLVSDQASWITGQALSINGGFSRY